MAKIKNLSEQIQIVGGSDGFEDSITFHNKKDKDGNRILGVKADNGDVVITDLINGIEKNDLRRFKFSDIKEPVAADLEAMVELINAYLQNGSGLSGEKQGASTGWLGVPPKITINTDNSKIDISAGTLELVDSSTVPATVSIIPFAGITAHSPLFMAGSTATFYSVGISGEITERVERSTPTQRRDFATIGLASHIDHLVVDVTVDTPQLNIDVANQIADFIRAKGFFSTSGNIVSGIDGGLTIEKEAGSGFDLNVSGASSPKDPHNINMPSLNPAMLFHVLRDGSIGDPTSVNIDPEIWDNEGVIDTVSSNTNATVSDIYIFPNNLISRLIPQQVYTTFSDAKDAVTLGTHKVVLPADFAQGGMLLARVILRKNASDFNNDSRAIVIPSISGNSAGGLITTTSLTINNFLDLTFEEVVISSGAVTAERSLLHVDTEGAAASDDLDTINGQKEGRLLIIHIADSGRNVTLKDSTGNIRLAGSVDYTLSQVNDTIMLIGTNDNWVELSRSNN